MKRLFFLLLVLMLTGCATRRVALRESYVEKRDSVRVEIRRDSVWVARIVRDTVWRTDSVVERVTVDQEGRIVMKERDAWHWKNEFRVETKEAGERREEVEKAESKEKTAEKAEKTKEKEKNWLERFGVLLGVVLIVGIIARLIYRKILG